MYRCVILISALLLVGCQTTAPADVVVAIPVSSQTPPPETATQNTINQLACDAHTWFFPVPTDIRLGCPIAAVDSVQLEVQQFEFGTVLHWPTRNLLYALLPDGTAFVYDNVWSTQLTVAEQPPEGRYFPVGEIGSVWQSGKIHGQPVRDRLMWATQETVQYESQLQPGSGYVCLTLSDGTVLQLPSEVGDAQAWRILRDGAVSGN